MIGRTAGYLVVLLVTGYLFFMYDDTVLSGILVLIFLYPRFLPFIWELWEEKQFRTCTEYLLSEKWKNR